MSGHPRLYRRGATYYHRAAIPVDIKDSYPKTEETFSLGTKDHQEAVRRVRVAAAKVDGMFDSHRRRLMQQSQPSLAELSAQQIKHIGEAYYAFRLEEDDETRVEGFYEPGGPIPELPATSFEDYAEDGDVLEAVNRQDYARGKVADFFLGEAEEVLAWGNVNLRLDPKSASWRKLARELQVASIRAAEAIRFRSQGNVVETPQTAIVESQAITPLLSMAVEEWAQEKARTSWVAKTEREHRVWMDHFITVAGDRPLGSYTKIDGRAFKAILLKLPANWNKFDALKALAFDRAAEKAHELGLSPMSDSNVNKLLGFVGSFWNWAANNFDDAPLNPLQGLKVKVRNNVREERDPFTLDELKAIFTAPLYTGCHSVRNWKQPGSQVPRDAGIFWVPLIALYTGARLGEIIQLYTDDVRENDGILNFDINKDGEDKRLKNPNSKRSIPIHSALIEMGLLEHIEKCRKQREQRLFPDLKMGADGYYSSPFSKHFNNRFLPSANIKRGKNAFHSFRHSFEDACRDCDISKEIMDALQGHGEGGMSARYGRGFMLIKLDEAMKKLRYRGLDLTHLVRNGRDV